MSTHLWNILSTQLWTRIVWMPEPDGAFQTAGDLKWGALWWKIYNSTEWSCNDVHLAAAVFNVKWGGSLEVLRRWMGPPRRFSSTASVCCLTTGVGLRPEKKSHCASYGIQNNRAVIYHISSMYNAVESLYCMDSLFVIIIFCSSLLMSLQDCTSCSLLPLRSRVLLIRRLKW